MIHDGFKIAQTFELDDYSKTCYGFLYIVTSVIHLMFTFAQTFFIFKNHKVCISLIISFRHYDEMRYCFWVRIRNHLEKVVTQSPANQHTCNLISFCSALVASSKIKTNLIFRKLARFWKYFTQKFSRSKLRSRKPFAARVNPLLRNTFLQFAFVFGTPSLKNQRTSNFWPNFIGQIC